MSAVGDQRRKAHVPHALRSARTAELILDIATAAAGEIDLDQILLQTLDRLGTVLPLTGGSIALIEGEDLVIRAAIGPFAKAALGQRLRRGASRSWGVVETLEPYLSGDLQAAGLHVKTKGAEDIIRSWLAVPIVRRGQGIGLLEIDSSQVSAFDNADVELLTTVVRALAGPVDLAGRYAQERRANALREAFIGVISHELRTPITTIYGLSKMLRQRLESLTPEVRDQAIGDVEAESDRLYRLVEDLLVLSRAEGGRVEIASDPIVLSHVLRRAIDGESARWPTRRFSLGLDRHVPLVLGEETYVEQVVRNLLTNAAKYSAEGATVTVRIEPGAGEVAVLVLDEGIGIAPEDTERVFELFYRSGEAARQASGAGIGLFVCRQLVEAMGGRIWARPRAEGGTEMGFALPAHAEVGPDA
jgi:two-component system, OmpR family, sensor histidine kinase KdpD